MPINKYDANLVKAGNSMAHGLEDNQKGGVSQIDIMNAKKTLKMLDDTTPKTSGQKGALTRVMNRLSEAINNAHVNPNVRGLPGGGGGRVIKVRADEPLPGGTKPEIIKIRADDPIPGRPGGNGPVIFKIRADDPLPSEKLSDARIDTLRAAADQLDNIQWKSGGFMQSQPIGNQNWASATLRDKRPVDGNLLTVYVQAGHALPGAKNPDPNKVNTFYLESTTARGGKTSWAGPFELNATQSHPMAAMLQAQARDFAMQAKYPLTRSDGVSLGDIKELKGGKLEVTLSVHHFLDPSLKHGSVTVTVDANGEFLKGTFKKTEVERPQPQILPKPGTHLVGGLNKAADDIATKLEFPRSRSDGKLALSDIQLNKTGGFDVTFQAPAWNDAKKVMGEMHVQTDKDGKVLSGFWTRGEVPSKVLKALDSYGELYAFASKIGQKHKHYISKSHTVDLVGIQANGSGKFFATINVNHWRTGEKAFSVEVELDKNGKQLASKGGA